MMDPEDILIEAGIRVSSISCEAAQMDHVKRFAVSISEPWEVCGDNAPYPIAGKLVALASRRELPVIRIARPIVAYGNKWKFVIAVPRHAIPDHASNLVLLNNDQAADKDFLANIDMLAPSDLKWVIGKVKPIG